MHVTGSEFGIEMGGRAPVEAECDRYDRYDRYDGYDRLTIARKIIATVRIGDMAEGLVAEGQWFDQ